MSQQDLERLCHENHKKVSNGERAMRIFRAEFVEGEKNPLYNAQIGVKMNEKGNAIIGYTYQKNDWEKMHEEISSGKTNQATLNL